MWYVSLGKYLFISQYQFHIAHNDLDYKDDLFSALLDDGKEDHRKLMIDSSDDFGRTPALLAASSGNLQCFQVRKITSGVRVCLRINCCMKQRIISWGTV